jgi:hypothetical protein
MNKQLEQELREKIENSFDDCIEYGGWIDYDKQGMDAIVKSHIDLLTSDIAKRLDLLKQLRELE